MNKTIYIFGHKNPDTDSAVAAVGYARLKHLQGKTEYKAARAGHLNPQTDYIFKKFNVPFPEYIPDLAPKVKYFMTGEATTVEEGTSIWSAVGKMDKMHARALPVVNKDGVYTSLLHYSSFAQNVLTILNPEHKVSIETSIGLIMKTMNAQPLIIHNPDEIFKATILVGAASDETFEKMLEAHASEDTIVITSDREHIYKACISRKVKLLIITSGYILNKELKEMATQNGVSVIMSPYATSDTVMMIAYSTPVNLMSDKHVEAVHENDTIAKIRPLLSESPCRCLPVTNDEGKVLGLISEHDLTNEPNISIILVDHNELTQAVDGVENYRIEEVIDHHRIGPMTTSTPITFINKPVGSTATLIANLYQEYRIPIPKDVASLLLCGILSDTLILQSATTTEKDKETAEYLANITDLDYKELGREILTAGSRVSGRKATEIIHQDMKEYKEDKLSYMVSQIEVSNFDEILKRKEEFMKELEIEHRGGKTLFNCLLVTDITQLSSALLIACDSKFKPFITFQKMDEDVYFLKDIVSRKKQFVPMISELVGNYLL